MARRRVGRPGRGGARFALAATGVLLGASTAGAQGGGCRVVCAPSLGVLPSVITTHVVGGPRVRSLGSGGSVSRLPSRTNFELLLTAGLRTALPRTSLYASAQWLPGAREDANPFTLYTAGDVGAGAVRANAPTLAAGLAFALLTAAEGARWVDVQLHAGDLYSQAARPDDRSAYTHKLDLGLVVDLHPFAALPAHTYLHGATLVTILDHVATGLPRAGDEVPKGARVFLSGARNASLIAGLAFPLTSPGS